MSEKPEQRDKRSEKAELENMEQPETVDEQILPNQ